MQLKQKWLKESELSTYAIVDYQRNHRYGGIETIEIIEIILCMIVGWQFISLIKHLIILRIYCSNNYYFLINELNISQEEIDEIRHNNVEKFIS